MDLKELLEHREHILLDCRDGDGYISEESLLDYSMPALNETKYVDTTDTTAVYASVDNGTIKVNAYSCNESGERLHVFIVNEESLGLKAPAADLLITQKQVYEKHFGRALNFLKKAIKGQIHTHLQHGSASWLLVNLLNDSDFLEQIDVIEIFLISATATVESRGAQPTAKTLEFDDEPVKAQYTHGKSVLNKEILVMRKLIDLNFLYNVHIAQGSRYPLIIDFTQQSTGGPIPFLHAASENDFDSYLCALPATLLANLYKRHSSRLLEKNVRSFLQITRGPNKGMHETIKTTPEKFVAYNNGLTITATSSSIRRIDGVPHIESLSDFQIVNGGQTTATLFFAQKLGSPIDAIRVMAKINVAKNASDEVLDELISNISKYANSQSKVSNVDLRARNPQLVKLKSLSESVLTTSGKKWFFERAKGEFATMAKINDKKLQLEKTFPKARRFSKEELAKYFTSWGEIPYAVKRGGEKVFRIFIEEISGEGKSKKTIEIDRAFYEDLIARIIVFRTLEGLYGSGNNSIGQLRSAVVPYTISILYRYTTGNKNNKPFNLERIWKSENLESDLSQFLKSLMIQVNGLIKKYSPSDDYGEYSKRKELWDKIADSHEIKEIVNSDEFYKIYEKYTSPKKATKKKALDLSLGHERQWETPLCYWSSVQLPGYLYSEKKQAWWKSKST